MWYTTNSNLVNMPVSQFYGKLPGGFCFMNFDTETILDCHSAEAIMPGSPFFEKTTQEAVEPMTDREIELAFCHGRD